ncbi:MAG: glycosyltransferase, partial [Acidobacterium ailaaui]|nr:glycosyltransferase [Pseudacidobacterium ailaaui]
IVSVLMITYNHERYIAQAIDSVLMQKTNFDYEIVIGEDCSTDRTREIVIEYKAKYPDKINLLLREKNVGMIPNFIDTLKACTGKYIALLEGDDYWTDPYKLQRQVDFLEANLAYSSCAHQSFVIYQFPGKLTHYFGNINSDMDLSINDVLGSRPFHTASLVFRNSILKNSSFPQNITSGDRALYLLCASYGKIRYLSDPMCAYRKHDLGISSWVSYDLLKKDLNIIPWIIGINPKFPKYKYLSYIHLAIFSYPSSINLGPLLKHFFLYLIFSFSYFPKNIMELFRSIKLFIKKLAKNMWILICH